MNRRVVVTGLGLVTPLGITVEATWAGLLAGKSGAGPITKFDASNFPVRFACEVKDFDPLNYVEKKESRKMGAFTQYAIAASDAISGSLLVCSLIAFGCSPIFALDPNRSIAQFIHTSWTAKDGAPSQISALAQTEDGYLFS